MIEIKGHAIIRDGEQIGNIDGDVAYMKAMPASIIKGQIRKAAGNAGLAFELEDEKPTQVITRPENTLTVEQVKEARKAVREATSAPSNLADLEAAAKAGLIPMPPAKHPAMGDKTPEFVEWVRQHLSPDDFQRHYHRRKIPASMQAFEAKDNLVTKRLNAAERNPETI